MHTILQLHPKISSVYPILYICTLRLFFHPYYYSSTLACMHTFSSWNYPLWYKKTPIHLFKNQYLPTTYIIHITNAVDYLLSCITKVHVICDQKHLYNPAYLDFTICSQSLTELLHNSDPASLFKKLLECFFIKNFTQMVQPLFFKQKLSRYLFLLVYPWIKLFFCVTCKLLSVSSSPVYINIIQWCIGINDLYLFCLPYNFLVLTSSEPHIFKRNSIWITSLCWYLVPTYSRLWHHSIQDPFSLCFWFSTFR